MGQDGEGEERGPCFPNNSCNAGLVCLSGLCVKQPDSGLPAGDSTSPGVDSITPKDGGGETTTTKFSFFVTSIQAMRKLSGSQDGFGGNLGGLTGADKICQDVATGVGFGSKTWRAFLSVTKGPNGQPVNAIDRIGKGPWYDRNGRLMAQDIKGLLTIRPTGNPQIVNDLPDEYGRGLKQFGDNHEVLTGSTTAGKLMAKSSADTCEDWTSSKGKGGGTPQCGVSWPRDSKIAKESWISARRAPGCAAGFNLGGGDKGTYCVGCKGGYGAIYCFALTP